MKENVSPLVVEAGPSFALKWSIAFLVVHYMLTEYLFFISWTPFIVCNMWSFAISTFWLLFSLFGHPLCEWPSPQITHLIFALQF